MGLAQPRSDVRNSHGRSPPAVYIMVREKNSKRRCSSNGVIRQGHEDEIFGVSYHGEDVNVRVTGRRRRSVNVNVERLQVNRGTWVDSDPGISRAAAGSYKPTRATFQVSCSSLQKEWTRFFRILRSRVVAFRP